MLMACGFACENKHTRTHSLRGEADFESERRSKDRWVPVNRGTRQHGREWKKAKKALSTCPLFCSKSLVPTPGAKSAISWGPPTIKIEGNGFIFLLQLVLSLQDNFSLLSRNHISPYAIMLLPQSSRCGCVYSVLSVHVVVQFWLFVVKAVTTVS